MKRFVRARLLQTIICVVGVAATSWALHTSHAFFASFTDKGFENVRFEDVRLLLLAIGPYLIFLAVPGKPCVSFICLLGILTTAMVFWSDDPQNWGPLAFFPAAIAGYAVVLVSLIFNVVKSARSSDLSESI